VQLAHLWLTDFRGHVASEVEVGAGMTVFAGGNAQGKTTVLEAVGWLARMSSFRGAPDAALVRVGCEQAVVRAEITPANRAPDVRPDLIEAEIAATGRNRVLLSRKPLPRARDLLGTLICVGVLTMVVFQVFENVGMTMGIMPIIGIPLPFLSYGGSATIASFAAIGLVLNVHMRRFA